MLNQILAALEQEGNLAQTLFAVGQAGYTQFKQLERDIIELRLTQHELARRLDCLENGAPRFEELRKGA